MSTPVPAPTIKKKGWLDYLSPFWRHTALMGIAYGLSHAAGAISALHLTNTESGLAGIGLTAAIAYFGPLTEQYGPGTKA